MQQPMSKIKSLQLNNFKFFRQSDPIILNGKHLLLYGENGSGKSSIFWGLYTLLEAAYKQPNEVKSYFNSSDTSLVNIFANKQTVPGTGIEHYDSYVTIETDNGKTFKASLLDTTICGNNDAKESRKAMDFLNYQSLFAFQHFKNSENVDLSDVFDYYILPYVTFTPIRVNGKEISNAGEMWKEYQNGPTKVGGNIKKNNKNEFQRFESHFRNEFQRLIDFINQNSYDIIKELGYDIHFTLSYTLPSSYIGYKIYDYHKYKIILTIDSYNGKSISINRPQTFLNEAKLTALALSIRLCVLKYRTNTLAADALQVLVLDDIMISLDMSNREMLSELLLKNGGYADKYQLLFFTHDRNLFQFIDRRIGQLNNKSNWKEIGIYIGKDSHGIEYPVIVDEEADSYSKAQKFKDAFDYETASIYIRKTLEQILKNLLPPEILKSDPDTFVSLQSMWDKFKQIYSPDANIINLFKNSKLLILNPSAHLLSKPIYKRELDRAFKLVDELKKISSKYKEIVLIEKGAKVQFKTTSTPQYLCSFNLDVAMCADRETKQVANEPRCSNIYFEYDGKQYYDPNTGQSDINHPLKTATPKLSRFVKGLSQNPFNITENDFLDNAKVNGISLREYLDGHSLTI